MIDHAPILSSTPACEVGDRGLPHPELTAAATRAEGATQGQTPRFVRENLIHYPERTVAPVPGDLLTILEYDH